MKDELVNSLKILKNQQILLYPTDTVWGIGCDATSEEAVSKIFKIKQRSESKSLIILVDGIEMLQKYVPETKILDEGGYSGYIWAWNTKNFKK